MLGLDDLGYFLKEMILCLVWYLGFAGNISRMQKGDWEYLGQILKSNLQTS